MSSGYNNPYYGTSTTFDNNPYWGSAYPHQPMPNFNNTYQPTANVDPYFSFPNSDMATFDHNTYLANTSDYPPQSDPCSNDLVTTTVHPNDSTDSDVDSVDSADSGARRFGLRRCALRKKKSKNQEDKEEHQRWMDTWYKGIGRPPKSGPSLMDYFVCTDGYYRQGRKGGHGVIIRDNVGKPIVASAVASTEAVSFLYHQVQGVSRGVELAVEYSLRDIQLFCNAKHVARLVNMALESVSGCTIHSGEENSFDVICKECVRDYTGKDYQLVFPLLKRMAEMVPNFFVPLQIVKVPRERNRAADYLAKNGAPGMEVLNPCGFPNELKEILCEDYVGSLHYGLPCYG